MMTLGSTVWTMRISFSYPGLEYKGYELPSSLDVVTRMKPTIGLLFTCLWLWLPGQPYVQNFRLIFFLANTFPMLRLRFQCPLNGFMLKPSRYCSRTFASLTPFPRVVGAGEAKSSTPIQLPPLPWYRQPRFTRNIVNILLLASFTNSAAIILSYKSQKREISWQSKERIQTLRETIEKVRKGESIDIRAALGTGDPEAEKRWKDGT